MFNQHSEYIMRAVFEASEDGIAVGDSKNNNLRYGDDSLISVVDDIDERELNDLDRVYCFEIKHTKT